MRRLWILGIPAMLLLATGCATKDFVRESLGKQSAETNQRFTQVEGKVSDESARVSDMEKAVEGASRAIARAQERADGAFGRADTAIAKSEETDNRLTRLWSRRYLRNRVDSVEVTFGIGRAHV